MADKKYTGYSVEELIEDREFISMVNHMTGGEWEQFLKTLPGSKENILLARRIINLFEISGEALPVEKKEKLWRAIRGFSDEFSGRTKIRRIKTFAKVAASVLIILSLGSIGYFSFQENRHEYRFSGSRDQLKSESTVLVLSGGNRVRLNQNEPEITVLKDQDAVQIDDGRILKNQPAVDKTSKKVQFNEIMIPFGRKSKLVLSDGTRVWLNAGSRLAFPQDFEGGKREVCLEGEGYFEVAKNEKQPFVISAGGIQVEVLGTKFNVCAYQSDDFIETVLLEGRVCIREKGKLFSEKNSLAPNQKATYNKVGKNIVVKDEPMAGMKIAWVHGWYPFSNENLEQVIKKLERYYNVTFEYDQAIISGALPVSGKLDLKESLDEVMAVLSGVAKIKYQISGNSVIIVN